MTEFDVVLRGGLMVDGTGGPPRRTDVAVSGGVIAAIDDLAGVTAVREIDATNKIVSPGFIDIHTHSDFSHFVDPRAESQIRQGVTTEAIGQCGSSLAPCSPEHRTSLFASTGSREHGHWHTYGELLSAMDEADIATNVVGFVGHGALRTAVMGPSAARPADGGEVAAMVSMLEQSLEEGAFGFSTGLEYHPGKMATFDELTALCKSVTRADALYATHSRNRDTRYMVGFGEALDLARDSGVRLQISHINPKYGRPEQAMSNTLQMIEWARDEGLDVAFDAMPTNWNLTRAVAMLPAWANELAAEELTALLKTVAGRRRLRDNPLPMWQLVVEERWDRVRVLAATTNKALAGHTIADIAEARNANSGWDALFDLMLEEGPKRGAFMLTSEAFAEEDIQLAMAHPLCAIESDTMAMANDGPFAGRMMGVHGYNWAPKFLARYVRNEKLLTLEEGVRRLTGLPAERLGLNNRGTIADGRAADLVVMDLEPMRADSSFEEPTRYADGISTVIVNGTIVFTDGERTGAHGGQVLRRS